MPTTVENPQVQETIGRILEMRQEAVYLCNSQRHAEAVPILAEAAELCRSIGREELLVYILHEKAITLSTGGNPAAALDVAAEAEAVCEVIGDWNQRYQILRSKTAFHGNLGDRASVNKAWVDASRLLDDWLKEARRTGDPRQLVQVLPLYAMQPGGPPSGGDQAESESRSWFGRFMSRLKGSLSAADPATEAAGRKTRLLDEALDTARRHGLNDDAARIEQVLLLMRRAGL
jgi:hypothetical protein